MGFSLFAWGAEPALAQCVDADSAKLMASDGEQDDLLGSCVAVSGDFAVAGAPFANPSTLADAGKAYIYRYDGLTWQEVIIVPDDAQAHDHFGTAVAVDGDVAVFGSPRDDDNYYNAGSAYVYRFSDSNWALEQKLTAGEPQADGYFGGAIAIDDDVAIIGAVNHIPYAQEDWIGDVYLFRYNGSTWMQEQKIHGEDPHGGMPPYFGESVAIEDDLAVVGDPRVNVIGDPGKVFVYRYSGSTWSEEAQLVPDDVGGGAEFGCAVAVSNDRIIIGAKDVGPYYTGTAYIYRFDGSDWEKEVRLNASDGAQHDRFGSSVSIAGDMAVVGAPGANCAYTYYYDGSTWVEWTKIAGSDTRPGDLFGSWVAQDGEAILVGSPEHDEAVAPTYDAGAAHVFTAGYEDCNSNGVPDACDLPDCNANGVPDECDITSGTSDDCNENGIPDECENAPALELVVVMDTSGSMQTEPELCDYLTEMVSNLEENGIVLIGQDENDPPHWFAINEAPGDLDCLQDNVADFIGVDVPGNPPSCGEILDDEDWGPATSVTCGPANGFDWGEGLRMLVVLSDEVPCTDGMICDDPDPDDVASIDYAVGIANNRNVTVMGVAAEEATLCVEEMIVDLSTGTGGQAVRSDSPAIVTALTRAITGFVLGNAEWDCNNNGVLDECDIADGTSEDFNGNGIPDECEGCLADVDDDGDVDTTDLLLLLAYWGECPDPPVECPADIDEDGDVDVADLLYLLGHWGPCDGRPGQIPQNVQDCIDQFGFGNPEALQTCIEAVTGLLD
jgi:hypothetical protein